MFFPLLVFAALTAESALAHHAYSFQHFYGPIEGHHKLLTWGNEHGHHYHDYVAHPTYKFHYDLKDHHTNDFHGHKEHGDGHHVSSEYHIHEPGGNLRTVKYHVDHHGFHPYIYNSEIAHYY